MAISQGPHEAVSGCSTSNCYAVNVTVSNFPAGADLQYYCSSNGAQYWPGSGTTDLSWSGSAQHANGSGAASFTTECVWGYWNNAGRTITVTVNGTSGSHTG